MLGTPMQNDGKLFTTNFGDSLEICAGCPATLFRQRWMMAGKLSAEFPEQTPYLEWKNSVYPAQNVRMPKLPHARNGLSVNDHSNPPVFLVQSIATRFLHYFVGGNTFMLNMLKSHGAEIGVTATARSVFKHHRP